MFLVIYIFIFLINVQVSRKIYKSMLNPPLVYSALWCFSGILAFINPNGFIVVTNTIHTYAVVSIISFTIVSCVTYRKNIENRVIEDSLNISNYEFKESRIIILAIVGILLLFPNVISALRMYSLYGFGLDVSRISYSEMTRSGRFFYVFFTCNIPTAIYSSVSILTCLELVKNKKRLLLISLIYIIMLSVAFGGRSYFLNFVVYYLVIFFYTNKILGYKSKFNMLFIGLFIAALIFVTISRGARGQSVIDWIVTYFSGSFSFLQYIVGNPSSYGLSSGLMFGYMSFGIFIEPLILLLKVFFHISTDVPSYEFNIYAQNFINISLNSYHAYNNNTTWLYTFIRDWGELGIVIGPSLFAYVMNRVLYNLNKSHSIRSLMIIAFLYSSLITSTMSYNLTSVASTLSLLFIVVFTTKITIKAGGTSLW